MSLQKKYEENFDSDAEETSSRWKPGQMTLAGCLTAASGWAQRAKIFWNLNLVEIRQRKVSYCLGMFSCLLVVTVVALMLTTLHNLPVLFLRLGESQEGQRDLILTPGAQAYRAASLNYSIIESAYRPPSQRSYHSPRITFPRGQLRIYSLRECLGGTHNATNTTFLWEKNVTTDKCTLLSGCAVQHCGAVRHDISLHFIDTAKERRMEVGRDWPFDALGASECIIEKSTAAELGVSIGDSVVISGPISDVLLQAFIESSLQDLRPTSQTTAGTAYSTYGSAILVSKVARVASDSYEKLHNDERNYVFMEYGYALETWAGALTPLLPPYRRAAFAMGDVRDVASEIVFNFAPDERMDAYSSSDYADIQKAATDFSSLYISELGFNQLGCRMPLVQFMYDSRFFSLFLGLIVSIIIMGLSVMSIILIYSLLTVSVETRTFELGVMRMVGMSRPSLIGVVLTNAMMFAIPAWILGLVVAQLTYLGIRVILSSALGVDLPYMLAPSAIGWATLAGIGIPMVSSIAPITAVLSQVLQRALDTQRCRIEMIAYEIERSSTIVINWQAVFLGTCLAVFGFLIFYLFPLSLVSGNFTILFYILFGVLVGLMFGLVLLVINFERFVELGVMYLFFYLWESTGVFTLIQKNLSAHRLRNRKTTLMYAMALGFIIFVTVAFQIQLESVRYEIRRAIGGEVRVKGAISYSVMRSLDDYLWKGPIAPMVRSASYVTEELSGQNRVSNTTLETLGRYAESQVKFVAVPPRFWDVADSSFLIVADHPEEPYSLGEALYSKSGSARAILPSNLKQSMAFDSLTTRAMCDARIDTGNKTSVKVRRVFTPLAFLDASPVLSFTKFPNAFMKSHAVFSMPTLLSIAAGSHDSIEDIWFEMIVVRTAEGDAGRVHDALVKYITDLTGSNTIEVADYYRSSNNLKTAETIVTVFFTFTQVVVMVICFFSLMSSMRTNIYEQTKEIGVLRAIGLKKFPCWRAYNWEAFVLVVASSLLGMAVGVVVGYTMMLQRAVFTQLPLPFVFPYLQLLAVILSSIAGALISSSGPIGSLLRSPSITHILRRMI